MKFCASVKILFFLSIKNGWKTETCVFFLLGIVKRCLCGWRLELEHLIFDMKICIFITNPLFSKTSTHFGTYVTFFLSSCIQPSHLGYSVM